MARFLAVVDSFCAALPDMIFYPKEATRLVSTQLVPKLAFRMTAHCLDKDIIISIQNRVWPHYPRVPKVPRNTPPKARFTPSQEGGLFPLPTRLAMLVLAHPLCGVRAVCNRRNIILVRCTGQPLYKGDGDCDSQCELMEPSALGPGSPIISSSFFSLTSGSPKGGLVTLGSNCHVFIRPKNHEEGIMLANSTHCRRHIFFGKEKGQQGLTT